MRIILLFFVAALMFTACQKQNAETDNIPLVAVGCDDGIQNQGETDVDCGGPCAPCTAALTAMVGSDSFAATTVTSTPGTNTLLISASESAASISLIHLGAVALGTFTNDQATYAAQGKNYTSNTATITFTKVENNAAEGTFSFTGIDFATGGTDSVVVTNGVFRRVAF